MNVAVKRLWAEHLRSDWYQQNFTIDETGGIPLRTVDNKWSLFGVLCNVHAQANPSVAQEENENSSYLDYAYVLPSLVAMWAGLKKALPYDPLIPHKVVSIFEKKYTSLEEMSLDGVPFFMIADMIEILL